MDLNEKIRQHYVSRFYLQNWQVSGEDDKSRLWVKNKKTGEIYPVTNLNKIAQKTRFYKMKVDSNTYDLLRYRYEHQAEHPFIAEMIGGFDILSKINAYQKEKLPYHEKTKIIESNFLEDKYSVFERKAGRTLRHLVEAGTSLVDYLKSNAREVYFDLIGLFFMQHFRTIEARSRVVAFIKSMQLTRGGDTLTLEDNQLQSVVKAMLFIDSIILADKMQNSNTSVTIEINDSDINFVTSSNPAIVEKASSDTIHLNGFMTLTPRLLMRLSNMPSTRKKLNVTKIDGNVVLELNEKIYAKSDLDVYSTNDRQLRIISERF